MAALCDRVGQNASAPPYLPPKIPHVGSNAYCVTRSQAPRTRKGPVMLAMTGPKLAIAGAPTECAGGRLNSSLAYCGFELFFFIVLWCAILAGAMPLPVPPAVGLLAAAPPATGGSPPVGGPFCAIASEVAPAIRAAASVIVLRVDIMFLRTIIDFAHTR